MPHASDQTGPMDLRRLVAFSGVVVAAMTVAGLVAWLQLPAGAQVPIHWGPTGEVDGYADKTLGLFLLPLIVAGLTALFVAIPRIEPRRANLERSSTAYAAIWIASFLLLGGLQLLVVGVALGATVDVTRLMLIGTGAMLIVIGAYLPRVRPNYMVGIRTPWTLTSDLSWRRTHRLGGRLFILGGGLLIAMGVVGTGPTSLLAILIGWVVLLVVIVFAYSYRVWTTDPDRRTS